MKLMAYQVSCLVPAPCPVLWMCFVTCGQKNAISSIISRPRNGLAQNCAPLRHSLCFWWIKKRFCLKAKVGKILLWLKLFELLQDILVNSTDRETQLLKADKSVCDANIEIYQEILNVSGRLAYVLVCDRSTCSRRNSKDAYCKTKV